jgi:hypothetical protein
MAEDYKPDETCFVICPIDDEGTPTRKRSDQVLKHIIAPACQDSGLEPVRSDKIGETRLITNQIVEHIVNDKLVVADLTDWNPNVFYELALRHAMQKPYVQLMAQGETLPFDVTNVNTIFYDLSDPDALADCKAKFATHVSAAVAPGARIESPFSVAVSLMQLLESGDQSKVDYAEIRSELSELRVALHTVVALLTRPTSNRPGKSLLWTDPKARTRLRDDMIGADRLWDYFSDFLQYYAMNLAGDAQCCARLIRDADVGPESGPIPTQESGTQP